MQMMGEQSYFHSRFFRASRLRKFKAQKCNASKSSLSADSAHPSEYSGKARDSFNNPPCTTEAVLSDAHDIDCDVNKTQEQSTSRPSSRTSHSFSFPAVEGSRRASSDDDVTKAAGCISRGDQNGTRVEETSYAPRTSPNSSESVPPAPDVCDHIETIEFHPAQASAAGSERPIISETHKSKGSTLRKATKAILLFKRATSSLAAHTENPPVELATSKSARTGGLSYPRSLVASFWRQSDSSTCTRSSSRNDSSTNCTNWNHSAPVPSSLNSSVSNPSWLAHSDRHRGAADQKPNASSTFTLPRFIVPRTNTLKLPIVCLIKSLDGELMREIFIHRYELGQYLIDNLKVSLDMKDAKYFGLKMAKSTDEQEDVRQPWLDLNDSVYKQISKHSKIFAPSDSSHLDSGQTNTKSVDFYLKIKYYPPNLARIQDQFLRNYLWLQLKRDLRLGKLTSSMNNLIYLMACILQYELGEYKQEYVSEKLSDMNILPNQDLIEQQSIELWKNRFKGTKRHQVQMQFLRASVILETYGFDYYPVRDHQRQRAYLLGFNYAGVKTIRNGRIIHHFRWHSLSKISYERRMIIFHIYPSENSKRKQILGFKCLSNEDCQNLYLRLLEQKYFFTVDLTYFDTSIRRPSYLESSLGLQEQQQLSDLTLSRPSNQYSSQLTDDEEDGALVDEFEEPSERSHDKFPTRPESLRDNATSNLIEKKSSNGLERSHGSSDKPKATSDINSACDCALCLRETNRTNKRDANNQSMDSTSTGFWDGYAADSSVRTTQLVKSCSLQETDGRQSQAYCGLARNFSTQPNSPDMSMTQAKCCVDSQMCARSISDHRTVDVCSSAPLGGRTHLSARSTALRTTLQRQPSVLQYSPDIEFRSSTQANSVQLPGQPSAGEAHSPETRVRPPVQAQQITADETLSRRVAVWAEHFLTQPSRMFGCHGTWPSGAAQAPTGQTATAPHDSSLFVQGLMFCLFILAMNFVLRLGDGISKVLIDLLTFR